MATQLNDTARDSIDETVIREKLRFANLNVLRLALYQATGDEDLAKMRVVTETLWASSPPYDSISVADEHHEEVIDKAVALLLSGEPSRMPQPDDAQLRRLMDIYAGVPTNDFLFHFGKEEIGLEDFPRAACWTNEPSAERKQAWKVLVIGAGVSGLVTGVQLGRLGIPYEIVERNEAVGGTWWTNDYPDARVDVASHHYQLSFVKNYPWKHWFAPRDEIRDYIQHVAEEFGVLPHIRFRTEIVEAKWDEAARLWRVTLKLPDGTTQEGSFNAIVSGAGLFNAVNKPDIPGLDEFQGKVFHTTEWDYGYDYTGRKICMIGAGCTGAQLANKVAQDAGHMTIFQRSPQWVAPVAGYRAEIPDEVMWLFDNVPHYWNWYCFSVFHTMFADDGALMGIDREWQKQGGIVSRRNDRLRENITAYIREQLAHDPQLAEKLVPDFAPVAKRLVVDNGWFEALRRPNVTLVTNGVERVTERGVIDGNGVEHECDLLVLSVGFATERYLWPTRYEGRDGITLEEAWDKDGARAYWGLTMPNFPNLFMIYGPNQQARAGGLFAWLEIWSRYAVQSIVHLIEQGKDAMEVRRDVFDAYNAELDVRDLDTVWAHTNADTYYINAKGRQGVNNPFLPSEFYAAVRRPDIEDFDLR